jgi:hypothetical protein
MAEVSRDDVVKFLASLESDDVSQLLSDAGESRRASKERRAANEAYLKAHPEHPFIWV